MCDIFQVLSEQTDANGFDSGNTDMHLNALWNIYGCSC